jgi:uncharacterized protein
MNKKNCEISLEKLERYFNVTQEALSKIKISSPEKTHFFNSANDFLDMATRYFKDANYFKDKNDFVNAFAALNYAHGWLDAGARLGLFDVGHDSRLFTVD